MKVLLITTLYPAFPTQSRQQMSYALHDFAKNWVSMENEVQVIKIMPTYPTLFNLFMKSKIADQLNHSKSFTIDKVNVTRVPVRKYPKLNYQSKDIIHSVKHITSILSHNKPDVIVCHMMNPSLYIASLIKKQFKIPLVFSLHQTDINHLQNSQHKRYKFNNILHNIDKIGFRSDMLKEAYIKLGYCEKDTFLVYSGINKENIISGEKVKEKINRRSRVIFIAASMRKRKNIDILIRAFAHLKSFPNTVLKIAGDGPEKKKLIKLVRDLDIWNNVEFLGYLEHYEVLHHMEQADVFAMVSSSETLGLVYLEAMAKGCITIGSKGEGIDGIILDGINGYLCKPRDINDLRLKLIKALNGEFKADIVNNAVKTTKQMTQYYLSEKYLEELKKLHIIYERNKADS
ncbi:glycosyltransferase [Gracilibacillus sp. JCM 18860]|uniref:glycosyltransferase n=1 Tax=Gracilibacillus sp. JCM 18860 TaxID=1306159 RepID=UPI0006D125F2